MFHGLAIKYAVMICRFVFYCVFKIILYTYRMLPKMQPRCMFCFLYFRAEKNSSSMDPWFSILYLLYLCKYLWYGDIYETKISSSSWSVLLPFVNFGRISLWRHQMEGFFSDYWPFVRGINRWFLSQKTSNVDFHISLMWVRITC